MGIDIWLELHARAITVSIRVNFIGGAICVRDDINTAKALNRIAITLKHGNI